MKKVLLATLALALLLSMFAGCNNNAQQTPTPAATPAPATTPAGNDPATPAPGGPKTGGDLRIITMRNPVAFGYPPKLTAGDRNQVTSVFERLIRIDDDGSYQPELATEWEFSADGKTLTFKLREGVKFHDGTDFNAQSVKDNFDALIPPESNILAGVSSVEVINDYTVQLSLDEYNNLLIYQIAAGYECMICSYEAIRKNGMDWAATNPVGTGPFKFESFESESMMKLVRNPDYWQEGVPYLDSITWLIIAEGTTQMFSYQAEEGDAIFDLATTVASQLEGDGTVIKNAAGALFCIALDTANNPALADVRVRQAIEYAIDKEAINAGPGNGMYIPAYQVVPTDSVYYNPDCVPRKYDPEKAKSLLAEAGYADGLTIEYDCLETYWRDGMIAVQAYLAEVGIEFKINYLPQAAYNALRSNSEIPAGHTSQFTMNLFSNNLFVLDAQWRANPSTYAFIETPEECDALLADAKAARDPAEALRLAQEVVKVLYDDSTVIPLWINPRLFAYRDYIINDGFYISGDANLLRPGYDTWLDK